MLAAIPESEATPFLYYVLAWPWTRLCGVRGDRSCGPSPRSWARRSSPSRTARARLSSRRRVGVIAAALVSVHPFLVWYAQEARAYSLFALLAAVHGAFLRARSPWRRPVGASRLGARGLARARDALLRRSFSSCPRRCGCSSVPGRAGLPPWRCVLPAAVGVAHLPLLLDQRGAGEAVTDASLGSRAAGVPKGLAVGYSFPAEIAGSVLAAALLAIGLVLLLTRAPAGAEASRSRAGRPGDHLDRRSGRAGARGRRLRDRPKHDRGDRSRCHLRRDRIRRDPSRARCGRRALRAAAGDHAIGLPRRGVRAHGLALGGRAPRRAEWRARDRRDAVPEPPALGAVPAELEEPSGDVVRVEEIAAIGLATEEGFSIAGPVKPPALDSGPPPPPARLPDGCRRNGRRRTHWFCTAPRAPLWCRLRRSRGFASPISSRASWCSLGRPDDALGPRHWLASTG